jgi:HTH-type transcriptional regulator/antitoxin HigA
MSPDLKPIRTRAEHAAALVEIQRLWKAKRNTPEGDRLDVIMTLVEAYEKLHFKLDPPDPIAAIEFRMEQQGLSRADLEPILGSRGRVSEVLNRRRGLSIEMIRRLNEELGISADVLIQPTVQSHKDVSKSTKPLRSGTNVLTHGRTGQRLTAARKAARRK